MLDFRSDTVTKPTKEMREAMMNAVVGDDVYQDDPTINELEALAAEITGKEAALFVTSGTMGNQLGIMANTKRGDEIILGAQSHIKNYEVGAAAVLSQVSFHLIDEEAGMMPLEKIEAGIRGVDIHYPETKLICLENAHGSGIVLSLEYMKEVQKIAQKNSIPIHLDGARFFNATTTLGCDPKELAQTVDTLTFCLSKGLAAPIGSILCGSKAFIERARKYRKMLGGGMRQVGVLGAPALISLNKMRHRLIDDHNNAKYFAKQLQEIDSFEVLWDRLDTNMVFVKATIDFNALHDYLLERNIIIGGYKNDSIRIAFHNDIKRADADVLIKHIKAFVNEV